MKKAELEAMSPEEVKQIANDLGVKFHHKHGKPKIIEAIVSAMDGAPVEDADEGLDEVFSEQEGEVLPDESPLEASEVAPALKSPFVAPRAVQSFKPDAALPAGNDWPTVAQVKEALSSHFARGLTVVELTDEQWHFKVNTREAAGNMKMPLKQVVMQANILLRPTKAPTEE